MTLTAADLCVVAVLILMMHWTLHFVDSLFDDAPFGDRDDDA